MIFTEIYEIQYQIENIFKDSNQSNNKNLQLTNQRFNPIIILNRKSTKSLNFGKKGIKEQSCNN